MSSQAGGMSPVPESRVYDSAARQFISMDDAVRRLASADVVFFGEQHDDPATHRAELAYLAAIGARNPNVIVSLEMFERDVQPVLDQYLAGEISDSVFMATSRPWPNYVKDYRPLVELARARGWPVIASNVPRRIASAVGRGGLAVLDTLPALERSYAARENVCPKDRYYELFIEAMGGHSAGDASASQAMADRFYEAQCVKDETMAESIAAALDRAGDAVIVHFNGAFHSNESLGTVSRVQRRRPGVQTMVLTAVPLADTRGPVTAEQASQGNLILLAPVQPPR